MALSSPPMSPSPPPVSPSITHTLFPLECARNVPLLPDIFHCYSPTPDKDPILAQHIDDTAQVILTTARRQSIENALIEKLRTDLEEQTKMVESQAKQLAIQNDMLKSLRENLTSLQTQMQETVDLQQTTITLLQRENSEQRAEIERLQRDVAQLHGDKLSQKEEYEKKIRQLNNEITDLKKEVARQKGEITQQKHQIAVAKEEGAQQLAAAEKRADDNLAQQLTAAKEEGARQLTAAEKRADDNLAQQLTAAEKRADDNLAQQLAAFKQEADAHLAKELITVKERTAQQVSKYLEEQEKTQKAKNQKKKRCLYFGNILLESLNNYIRTQTSEWLPDRNPFSFFINEKIKQLRFETTVGVFAQLSNYSTREDVKRANDDACFTVVCEALSQYPLLQPLPGKKVENKVLELSGLIFNCSQKRNLVAHMVNKGKARQVVPFLIEDYGAKWGPFIREIVK